MATKRRSPAPHGKAEARLPEEAGKRFTAKVEAVGVQGRGVAQIDGTKVFIPYTLPGETVLAEAFGTGARLVEIEQASPERIEPVCKHFGTCGGCTLQHWSEARYRDWKVDLINSALSRVGIKAVPEKLRSYPVSSRRRATLAARKAGGVIEMGFHSERTHTITDLEECPVLMPEITAALPDLKSALLAALPSNTDAKVHVTLAANGLDCAIEGPSLPMQAQVALVQRLAEAHLIRLSWNRETLMQTATPFVSFASVKVPLPPCAFLQAVEACEWDMASWVLDALTEIRAANEPVCDLFAGLGAFTFPVSRVAPVSSYEENAEAIRAVAKAAGEAKGLKRVSATRRDLFRAPLGSAELNKFACIIADPPRQGAQAQCHALASSQIRAVIMLSCNPATFARDASILLNGGLQLAQLAAFDQFRFTAHVEIAALFVRPAKRKGGPSSALKQ